MAETVDTPTAILASAAASLREHTFDDISYRALGDAVGVSERTVYRQYPTRPHLLESLAGWIEDTEFRLPDFVTIPQFQSAVADRFRAFDAAPAFAFVCARAASISPTGDAEPTFLTRTIVAMLETAYPRLNDRDLHRAAATLRYFASAQFWARMRTGFDMSARETAEVFDRTVERALAALPAVTPADRLSPSMAQRQD
ncbi:TetR family transcriptional regulator [Microbacterium allomyrinae]|uniref:TetR/AcrR family transcriptional regulator n=1 Tax=Microbacterium allomyrinae TaxID=2830666 RepID=A0A9X1S2Y3_9MICO|nr:TetR/AcrR family transcriptional regulator [Microbacterium allomyrinae]MCC2031423.1 TetR/AcrR family transcriptional regulator [Microbacterium allomyrinae]